MGSVYSSSACSFIWLGPGDEDSDQALSFIDYLQQMVWDPLQQMLRKYVPGRDAERIGPDNVDLSEDMVLTSRDQAWAKLEALFSRPWFHRSWTFQEPIRAPDRMIACGSKIQSWDKLVRALSLWLDVRHYNENAIEVLPFFTIQNSIRKKPGNLRLSRLIYLSKRRRASDPRDKVYALYGLVQAYQKVPLEISYSMSVEDVYRSTVRFCIENEGSLSILEHVSEFRNQLDLPSWVPDWRDPSNSGCPPVIDGDVLKFRASSTSRPLLVPSFNHNKLILKGFI